MDPISAVGVLSGALQIAQIIGQTIAALASLRGKIKIADITIRSLITELSTVKSAICHLEEMSKYNGDSFASNTEYCGGLEVALEGCKAVMEVLWVEVHKLTFSTTGDSKVGFADRFKVMWNDELMTDLRDHLQSQVHALDFLLQVCQCYSTKQQLEILQRIENRQILEKVASETTSLRSRLSRTNSLRSVQLHSGSSTKPPLFIAAINDTTLIDESSPSSTVGGDMSNFRKAEPDIAALTNQSSTLVSGNTWTNKELVFRPPLRPIITASPEFQEQIHSAPLEARPSRRYGGGRPWHSADNSPESPNDNSHSTYSPKKKGSIFSLFRKKQSGNITANLANPSSRSLVRSPATGLSSRRMKWTHEFDSKVSIDLATASDTGFIPEIVRAAQLGSRFEVERLLASSHDIEARHFPSGKNALLVAAHCGREDIVELLLQNNANLDVCDSSGSNMLHLAASRGHLPVMDLLFMQWQRPDIEGKTVNHCTPLYMAASNGHLEAARFLLLQNAKVNARAGDQTTALHIAAKQGDVEMAGLLVSYAADVDARDSHMMTALHYASQGDFVNIIDLLVSHNASIDICEIEQKTPLMCAALNGQLSAVRALLKNKANIRCLDGQGMNALHLAASKGHEEVVDILGQKRGTLLSTTCQGKTALHIAVEDSQFAVVEYLLRRNLPLESLCRNGLTALHYASLAGRADVFQLLITSGADVEATTPNKDRPIHLAAAKGFTHLISILRDRGAFLEAKNSQGDRPISVACRHGHEDTANTLLDLGAQLLLQDNPLNRDSPLCIAAMKGHKETVELLLKRGAPLMAQNRLGWSPIRYAAHFGHLETLRVLISAGDTSQEEMKNFFLNYVGPSAVKVEFCQNANISDERKTQVMDILCRAQHKLLTHTPSSSYISSPSSSATNSDPPMGMEDKTAWTLKNHPPFVKFSPSNFRVPPSRSLGEIEGKSVSMSSSLREKNDADSVATSDEEGNDEKNQVGNDSPDTPQENVSWHSPHYSSASYPLHAGSQMCGASVDYAELGSVQIHELPATAELRVELPVIEFYA